MLDEQAGDECFHSDRRINSVDEFIGARLKSQRVKKGLSQHKLAIMLDTTTQQVQRYEHGIDRLHASRLFEVAAILNVSVRFFFDDLN